jgi:hypothetical protein
MTEDEIYERKLQYRLDGYNIIYWCGDMVCLEKDGITWSFYEPGCAPPIEIKIDN